MNTFLAVLGGGVLGGMLGAVVVVAAVGFIVRSAGEVDEPAWMPDEPGPRL